MKKLVVLSGSGISAESGLATFRGNDGLWDNYPVEDVASIEGWYRNPGLVIEFYNRLRAKLADIRPNRAHLDIAALEKDYDVTVVTQNVDDLHERAGSSRIIHLHGELTKVRPENRSGGVRDIGYGRIELGEKEHGAQLRPHIVWFGESVPEFEPAVEAVSKADILLIVGTSMQVYPAASLMYYADPKCRIFVVDPADVPTDGNSRVVHIKEKATTGVARFIAMIQEKEA
ncbi:MAG: NAD-dependent deacylase [Bacteroidales bacterium]|nr:NAD-dependent deacylase [Bacteroidales bacterium]MBP5634774.1 NAD-dependent deacylase [Bacteroidales bacterium]